MHTIETPVPIGVELGLDPKVMSDPTLSIGEGGHHLSLAIEKDRARRILADLDRRIVGRRADGLSVSTPGEHAKREHRTGHARENSIHATPGLGRL